MRTFTHVTSYARLGAAPRRAPLRRLAFLAALLLVSGCESFEPADPSDYAPVLAVSAVFEADQPWFVQVTRTVGLNQNTAGGPLPGFAPIENATVTITDEDGPVLVLPSRRAGRYGAQFIDFADSTAFSLDDPRFEDGPAPEAGHTYTLRVEAPGFEPLIATDRAPLPAEVSAQVTGGWERSVRTIYNQTVASYSDATLGLTSAPRRTEARIELTAATAALNADNTSVQQDRRDCLAGPTSFSTTAPLLAESTFLSNLQDSGRRRFLSAFLSPEALGSGAVVLDVQSPGGCMVGVDVVAASEDYYRFRQSSERQQAAERNPFAEPVPGYSNVSGGVGIFAGATRTRVRIRR